MLEEKYNNFISIACNVMNKDIIYHNKNISSINLYRS